jgi:hypothetical protein
LGVDADGGPPDGDFNKDGGGRVAVRRCPYGLFAAMAGAVSNLICEADNELRPLRQVLAPNGMILKGLRNARKPRQWAWAGSCGLWEAPVEHGGHVCRGLKVASGGGRVQVDERMPTGLSRQCEQVCSEGRPRQLAREFRDDLVGSAVECFNDLRSNQLLGRHLEPVRVALDGRVEPGSRVGEFSQQCCSRAGGVVAVEDLLQGLGRGAGATVSGRMRVCGSPSPTTCK